MHGTSARSLRSDAGDLVGRLRRNALPWATSAWRSLRLQRRLLHERALVVRTHGCLATQLHQIVTAEAIAARSGRPTRYDPSCFLDTRFGWHPDCLATVLPGASRIEAAELHPRSIESLSNSGARPPRRRVHERFAPVRLLRADLDRLPSLLDAPVALWLEGDLDGTWPAFASATHARRLLGALATDTLPEVREAAVVLFREPFSESRARFEGRDPPPAGSLADLRRALARAIADGVDRVRLFGDDPHWLDRRLPELPELQRVDREIIVRPLLVAADLARILRHGTILSMPHAICEWLDLLKHPGTTLRVCAAAPAP